MDNDRMTKNILEKKKQIAPDVQVPRLQLITRDICSVNLYIHFPSDQLYYYLFIIITVILNDVIIKKKMS